MTHKNQPPASPQEHSKATYAGAGGSADTRNPDWDAYVPEGHGHTDEQIRADVQQKITAESSDIGDHTRALSVTVFEGVVTLEGEVASQALQKHLTEIIRAVPSVRDVDNRLRVSGD